MQVDLIQSDEGLNGTYKQTADTSPNTRNIFLPDSLWARESFPPSPAFGLEVKHLLFLGLKPVGLWTGAIPWASLSFQLCLPQIVGLVSPYNQEPVPHKKSLSPSLCLVSISYIYIYIFIHIYTPICISFFLWRILKNPVEVHITTSRSDRESKQVFPLKNPTSVYSTGTGHVLPLLFQSRKLTFQGSSGSHLSTSKVFRHYFYQVCFF